MTHNVWNSGSSFIKKSIKWKRRISSGSRSSLGYRINERLLKRHFQLGITYQQVVVQIFDLNPRLLPSQTMEKKMEHSFYCDVQQGVDVWILTVLFREITVINTLKSINVSSIRDHFEVTARGVVTIISSQNIYRLYNQNTSESPQSKTIESLWNLYDHTWLFPHTVIWPHTVICMLLTPPNSDLYSSSTGKQGYRLSRLGWPTKCDNLRIHSPRMTCVIENASCWWNIKKCLESGCPYQRSFTFYYRLRIRVTLFPPYQVDRRGYEERIGREKLSAQDPGGLTNIFLISSV